MAAPKGNKNAEKWTIEEAELLFKSCLETAEDKHSDSNDFIGEVAQENKTTLNRLDYLMTKYPLLEGVYKDIKNNCEANCFKNGKKGKIIPSLAIMNLKSNHGWTDRVDSTTNGKDTNVNIPVHKWLDED
jgi:hypothetical protein